MISFNNADLDKPKTGRDLARIFSEDVCCQVPECGRPLTSYQGPGADLYCRKHQRQLAHNGGLAVPDKVYSFVRSTLCQECGYDADLDPRIVSIDNEVLRNTVIRTVMTVDHIDGNHNNNSSDNLQCLCARCHAVKTAVHGDNLTPRR